MVDTAVFFCLSLVEEEVRSSARREEKERGVVDLRSELLNHLEWGSELCVQFARHHPGLNVMCLK